MEAATPPSPRWRLAAEVLAESPLTPDRVGRSRRRANAGRSSCGRRRSRCCWRAGRLPQARVRIPPAPPTAPAMSTAAFRALAHHGSFGVSRDLGDASVMRIPGGGAVHLDADGRLRRRSLVCRPARGQHQAGDLSLSALRQAPAGAGRASARPTRGRPRTAPPRAHDLRDARTACRAPAAARGGRAPPARMAVAAPATGDAMSPGPGAIAMPCAA
jgi:hypothetical protein